jgi:hypothetical protein
MKYLPSVLVELNGKMAKWKELHIPMDRAMERSTLTLSPCKKKDIILSESLLVFMLEKYDP